MQIKMNFKQISKHAKGAKYFFRHSAGVFDKDPNTITDSIEACDYKQ